MLPQKTWEDCICQLPQLRDLSSEGPVLHVAFYEAVEVLTELVQLARLCSASAQGTSQAFLYLLGGFIFVFADFQLLNAQLLSRAPLNTLSLSDADAFQLIKLWARP